jgi:hypothetical protein
MLRYCNQRSKSCYGQRNRHYQSATSTPASNDQPLHALKLRIRAAAHQSDAGPLGELRQSSLYQECYEWGRRQAQAATRNGAPETLLANARNAATVHTICYALDALVDFSRHYELQSARSGSGASGASGVTDAAAAQELESEFLRQIRSTHHHHLLAQFHDSFRANSAERRAAVLSALDCKLTDKLQAAGVISMAGMASEVRALRVDPTKTLNEAELLAVVDYLNSATGTFNAVNGAAMASAYYGEHALQARISVFSTALASAIAKLCDHPYFGRRDIIGYKGIRLNGLDSPFRLAVLSEASTKGGLVAFPNVLSVSADPEHSYARKKFGEGYTLECMITMRRAFYADPFHDASTMGEQEILGPAHQRFRVSGKSSISVFDWSGHKPQEVEVDRYELTPADR